MANEKLIPLSEVKKKLTAVRQYFSGYPSTEQDKLARSVVKLCMEEVGKIKPVDAAPVVHGHMVKRIVDHECPWYTVYDCSECGCTVEIWHNYCPNCGAKMDGERKDNE